MNNRRQWMIVVLVVLIALPIVGGFGIGQVELAIWAVLLIGWLWLFRTWARGGSAPGARGGSAPGARE